MVSQACRTHRKTKVKRSPLGPLKDDMQELQESSQQASHVNNCRWNTAFAQTNNKMVVTE